MNYKLTNTQVTILKTLVRYPEGLARARLGLESGVMVSNDTLGPTYQEGTDKHPESLIAYGLVSAERYRPDEPVVYLLTAEGMRAAKTYSARRRGATDKVPPELLNPIVLKIKPLKPYGIENFTDEDVEQIRSELPDEHQTVEIESLRRQIANQRKIGAYSANQYVEPSWYQEYRTEREFILFAGRVRDHYEDRCAVCSRKENVETYHRMFQENGNSVLYLEESRHGILLCGQCHKRNYRFMCKIPETEPNTFCEEI